MEIKCAEILVLLKYAFQVWKMQWLHACLCTHKRYHKICLTYFFFETSQKKQICL